MEIIVTEHKLRNMPDGPQRMNAEKKVLDALDEMSRSRLGATNVSTTPAS